MPRAWRLVREHYAYSAFSGEGAAKAGGRWNSRGLRAVYASESLSLAALETLVHLNPRLSLRYAYFSVLFPKALIEVLPPERLPSGWNTEPPPDGPKRIGDQWLREQRSAVLQVPSVLVPTEWNFVINPAHPDFSKVSISKSAPYSFDARFLR